MYGKQVQRYGREPRSVLGRLERSPAGNVVLRVGRELEHADGTPAGWEQSEHVVLTPNEAHELIADLARLLEDGSPHSVRVLERREPTRVPVTFVGPDGERTQSYVALERPTFRDHGEEIASLTSHHREHKDGWIRGCPWCEREHELAGDLLDRAERGS